MEKKKKKKTLTRAGHGEKLAEMSPEVKEGQTSFLGSLRATGKMKEEEGERVGE